MASSAEGFALMGSVGPGAGSRADPYPENADWEVDREVLLARSDRRAWAVAGITTAVSLLSILALVIHGAWSQTVVVPIVVDKATGETTVAKALDVDTVPAHEALDKHYAWLYVLARERYDWSFLQMDYDTVAAFAAPAVFREYGSRFEGPNALQSKLGDAAEWKVRVINIRLEPQSRPGQGGVAVVIFTKQVATRDRAPEPEARFVATVAYEYHPKLQLKERDRVRNPFGYVVTAYRADPDITNSTARTEP